MRKYIIFQVVTIIALTIACGAIFAGPDSRKESGQSSRNASRKGQVETLIAPHKFKMQFENNWSFGDVDTATDSDIVFYLKDNKGHKLFIWLTPRNEKIWRQAQSKTFNMIAVAENSDKLTRSQVNTAGKVFALIQKNDRGGLSFQGKISFKKSNRTLQLSVNKEKRDEQTSHVIKNRMLLLVAILFATTLLFTLIVRRIRKAKS